MVRPVLAACLRSWRMPSALVRPPRPTYMVLPTCRMSPPSSVPGASIRATSSPSDRTASSVPATSGRRSTAPGLPNTARSPHTTTVSSTNAESGESSAAGTSRIVQPASASASTYPSCCLAARPASAGTRSMCVVMPSAILLLDRLTSATFSAIRRQYRRAAMSRFAHCESALARVADCCVSPGGVSDWAAETVASWREAAVDSAVGPGLAGSR